MTLLKMWHTPDRPAWNCRTCREPWPCEGAKAELLAVYDVGDAELRRLLSFSFVQVVDDFRAFGRPRPADFGERLFGWIAASIIVGSDDGPPVPNAAHWSDPTPRLGLETLSANSGRFETAPARHRARDGRQ